MTLLYDADCGFCTRAARLGARVLRGVQIRSLQSVELAALDVDPVRAAAEIPFRSTNGEISYGSDAIAAALIAAGRPQAWLGRLLLAYPLRPLARAGYRLVARNRHRLPGGEDACALPR
ncbi:MAG: DCC1-like thiol-disulfide oxidoreductase family protein [Jatrophihabitantaceae bacterium]